MIKKESLGHKSCLLDGHLVFEAASWFAGSVIQVALLETHCNMVWKVEM